MQYILINLALNAIKFGTRYPEKNCRKMANGFRLSLHNLVKDKYNMYFGNVYGLNEVV